MNNCGISLSHTKDTPMPRVPYYLVCHETKTKVFMGSGYHTFEVFDPGELQGLADFLADNVPYLYGLEIPREDTADYKDYSTQWPEEVLADHERSSAAWHP